MRIGVRRALLAVVFVSFVGVGCEPEEKEDDATPTPTDAPAPPVGAVIPEIQFADGWTNPRRLPDGTDNVNTTGWEDSSFVSPDGTTLYFGYSRGNVTMLVNSSMQVADGPMRPGHHFDGFDIYEATIDGDTWTVTNSSVNDSGDISEAAQGVDAERTLMAFIRFEFAPGYTTSIYFADWDGTSWTNIRKAAPPMNTDCAEDNPTLSADGLRLYWDSDRADVTGTSCLPQNGNQERFIWMSTWNGDDWSTPVKIAGQDWTTPVVHWQPYEDFAGENLYWSGADINCPFGCLYKAPITGAATVGTAATIAEITAGGNGHPWAIGEMSITADGHYLYFSYGMKGADGTIDVSIGVAER